MSRAASGGWCARTILDDAVLPRHDLGRFDERRHARRNDGLRIDIDGNRRCQHVPDRALFCAGYRRCITITLTESGQTLIQQIFPHHVQQVVRAASPLTLEEQHQLAALCRKLGLAQLS